MARVKGGSVSKTRRRKVLKQAKGYFGSKHRLYKTAQEQVFHSGAYAYRDRRQKKREFRKLWITRINAACRENDISYSKFINGLNIAGVTINRKMLAEVAIDNKEAVKPDKEETKKAEAKSSKKEDYSSMSLADLKAVAKEKGIKGYSTMKKAELLEALK